MQITQIVLEIYTDTDTLLTKKSMAPQGINDIHLYDNILTKHLLCGHGIQELRCQIGYWLMSVTKMSL